jgi:hypothetical protein
VASSVPGIIGSVRHLLDRRSGPIWLAIRWVLSNQEVVMKELNRINARFAAEVEAAWKAYEKSDRRDDRALADAVSTALLERQDRLLSHGLIPYPTIQPSEQTDAQP